MFAVKRIDGLFVAEIRENGLKYEAWTPLVGDIKIWMTHDVVDATQYARLLSLSYQPLYAEVHVLTQDELESIMINELSRTHAIH
jgi:hypothetical protein